MEQASLTITSEQAEAIANCIKRISDAIVEVFEEIVKVVKKAIKCFVDRFTKFVCKAALSGKEFHLSQYAKKWRVRKKYRNKAFAYLRRTLT